MGETALGTIPATGDGGYASDPDWYARTAGVVALPLTADQIQGIATAPLTLTGDDGSTISEWSNGAFLRADRFVYRLSPGDDPQIPIYATQFGKPLAGVSVSFALDPSQLQPTTAGFPYVAAGPPVAEPDTALGFDTPVPTDANGVALLSIRATDPGTPRWFNNGADYGIDGQVYGIRPSFADAAMNAGPVNQWSFISFLLWSGYTPANPVTWTDVQPIFQQYANLYPVMLRFLNLADYKSVLASTGQLSLAFGLDVTDPNSMPVTRDLSPAKRATILAWLAAPWPGEVPTPSPRAEPASLKAEAFAESPAPAPPGAARRPPPRAASSFRPVKGRPIMIRLQRSMIAGLTGPSPQLQAVLTALQSAIELEHATIPVYLYALYSLDQTKNAEIAEIIDLGRGRGDAAHDALLQRAQRARRRAGDRPRRASSRPFPARCRAGCRATSPSTSRPSPWRSSRPSCRSRSRRTR